MSNVLLTDKFVWLMTRETIIRKHSRRVLALLALTWLEKRDRDARARFMLKHHTCPECLQPLAKENGYVYHALVLDCPLCGWPKAWPDEFVNGAGKGLKYVCKACAEKKA